MINNDYHLFVNIHFHSFFIEKSQPIRKTYLSVFYFGLYLKF